MPILENPVDNPLLDSTQVAKRLSCCVSKAYRLMHAGVLPTVRIGRSVRVPAKSLEQWIADTTKPGRVAAGGAA